MEAFEIWRFLHAFTLTVMIVASIGVPIFAAMVWAFQPWADSINKRIAESKRRNPRVYGHLPDKTFPWDKDPV